LACRTKRLHSLPAWIGCQRSPQLNGPSPGHASQHTARASRSRMVTCSVGSTHRSPFGNLRLSVARAVDGVDVLGGLVADLMVLHADTPAPLPRNRSPLEQPITRPVP